MPLTPRLRPLLAALTGALVAAILPGAVSGSPATAAVPAAVPAVAGYDAVCENMHTLGSLTRGDVKRARAIMAGSVDMGQYGTMRLAANPTWKPQSTLDTAGDRYMHALHWALPLLKAGLSLGDAEGVAMQARFTALMKDWVADNPVAKRTYWQNHPQYLGFRIGTFVCMNRLAASSSDRAWATAQLRVELKKALAYGTSGNNTTLNLKLATYAAAKQAGSESQRTTARQQALAVAARLAYSDGSDLEGAPGYGLYLGTIMYRTQQVFTAYRATESAARIGAMLNARSAFYAQASRPDRVLETIGDTAWQTIPSGVFSSGSEAEWVRTSGAAGRKPTRLYSRYAGGYVFGRSGWVAGTDTSSTFYSLRTADRYALPAHRHADTTGMTLFGAGVAWAADPGPYAYDGSSLRSAVVRRNAHSALVAPGTPNRAVYGRVRAASSTSGIDRTCVYDPGYLGGSGFELTRCTYYVRGLDAVVVEDLVRSTKSAGTVQQQWVLPAGVSGRTSGHTVALSAKDTRGASRTARLVTTGTPRTYGGSTSAGILGQRYGVATRGSVVRVPITVRTGKTATVATAFSTRGGVTVARTTSGGAAALRVSVNGRAVTFRTSVSAFERLAAKASLSRSKKKARVGQKVRFTARATAYGLPAKKAKVVLQEYRKKGWRKVTTVRTGKAGKARATVRMTSKGKHRYRVVVKGKKGTSGWLSTTSSTVTVKVKKRR